MCPVRIWGCYGVSTSGIVETGKRMVFESRFIPADPVDTCPICETLTNFFPWNQPSYWEVALVLVLQVSLQPNFAGLSKVQSPFHSSWSCGCATRSCSSRSSFSLCSRRMWACFCFNCCCYYYFDGSQICITVMKVWKNKEIWHDTFTLRLRYLCWCSSPISITTSVLSIFIIFFPRRPPPPPLTIRSSECAANSGRRRWDRVSSILS